MGHSRVFLALFTLGFGSSVFAKLPQTPPATNHTRWAANDQVYVANSLGLNSYLSFFTRRSMRAHSANPMGTPTFPQRSALNPMNYVPWAETTWMATHPHCDYSAVLHQTLDQHVLVGGHWVVAPDHFSTLHHATTQIGTMVDLPPVTVQSPSSPAVSLRRLVHKAIPTPDCRKVLVSYKTPLTLPFSPNPTQLFLVDKFSRVELPLQHMIKGSFVDFAVNPILNMLYVVTKDHDQHSVGFLRLYSIALSLHSPAMVRQVQERILSGHSIYHFVDKALTVDPAGHRVYLLTVRSQDSSNYLTVFDSKKLALSSEVQLSNGVGSISAIGVDPIRKKIYAPVFKYVDQGQQQPVPGQYITVIDSRSLIVEADLDVSNIVDVNAAFDGSNAIEDIAVVGSGHLFVLNRDYAAQMNWLRVLKVDLNNFKVQQDGPPVIPDPFSYLYQSKGPSRLFSRYH
ncbi:MAG: hypothetical protein AB1540_11180 [Bdellovibrionota bacterium]